MKYILPELRVPWPMCAISETYNHARIILELVGEIERDYY